MEKRYLTGNFIRISLLTFTIILEEERKNLLRQGDIIFPRINGFLHFLEECPQGIAVDSVESLLKLPDGTRIKRFEIKGIPY